MRIIRFLAGVVLFELAAMGVVVTLSSVLNLWDAAHWQREAAANYYEWQSCDKKHNILVKQIKNEGLWARLGMRGQPWLH